MIDRLDMTFRTNGQTDMIKGHFSPGDGSVTIGTNTIIMVSVGFMAAVTIAEGVPEGTVPIGKRMTVDALAAKMSGRFNMTGCTIGSGFMFKQHSFPVRCDVTF